MTRVDIRADLNGEDETGFVWTLLEEADDPSVIRLGAVVVAGSPLTPAVCEVIDLIDKPAGTGVHLRVLTRICRTAHDTATAFAGSVL